MKTKEKKYINIIHLTSCDVLSIYLYLSSFLSPSLSLSSLFFIESNEVCDDRCVRPFGQRIKWSDHVNDQVCLIGFGITLCEIRLIVLETTAYSYEHCTATDTRLYSLFICALLTSNCVTQARVFNTASAPRT